MNLSLDNNVNKFVLLVVIGVIVLLIVNMNKKQLGNVASTIISILVIVVCGYFGYVLLNDEQEQFDSNPYLTDSPAEPFYGAHGPNEEHEEHEEHFYGAHEKDEDIENYFNYDDNENANATNANANANATNANANATNANANANTNVNANANTNDLNVDNHLPADTNSTWAQVNPDGVGGVTTNSFLNAGFHLGLDTQGCSLRNANRGLRSEPPNPQLQVSPWLNTTICPDQLRKPLDCL